MIRKIFIGLYLILAAFWGIAQEGKVRVEGFIVDHETYKPVPFATTILYEVVDSQLIELRSYATDQSAKYEYFLEPGKSYKILGNAPEYLANEIEVNPQQSTKELLRNISIKLEPFERSTETIVYKWIPLTINILDFENKESIKTPEILIYAKIDTRYFRQYTSHYFTYKDEILFYGPRLYQGMSYKAEINAPDYEPQAIYFQLPQDTEAEEFTVYMKKIK